MNRSLARISLTLFLSAACLGVIASAEDLRLDEIRRPIVSKRNLLIREIEGIELKADMFRPDDESEYPLVMMIHGGAWSAGDKWELIDHARELAQAGFVAVSINYRLAPRFKIGHQVADCRYALTWAIDNADEWSADKNRIGLWGYSAGAHLASLVALQNHAQQMDSKPNELTLPDIGAVVAGGAPCEFSFIGENSPVLVPVMGGTRAEMPDFYREMSPVEYARPDAPPFFLFHGKADLLVPPSSSQALYQALSDLGAEVQYYWVPFRGHWLTFLDLKARRQAVEFLSKHLKNAP